MTRRFPFTLLWLGVILFTAWLCFGNHSRDNAGPVCLQKPVPAWFAFQNYDEAVELIRERTGYAVDCPSRLEALLREAPLATGIRADPPDKQESARVFLNRIVRCSLGLEWRFNEQTRRIELALPWKHADPRPARELLGQLWNAPTQPAGDWQCTLDALLSKPGNFEKAWRVRQFSRYQSVFHSVNGERFLVKRVLSETQQPYVLVLIRHRIQAYPGRGAVSCYWFQEDGTLRGADLLDSGWRCDLTDASISPDPDDALPNGRASTELRWNVTMNVSATYVARFRFTDEGLRWIATTSTKGEEADLQLGHSLMPRETPLPAMNDGHHAAALAPASEVF